MNEVLILIDIQNMYFIEGAYKLHEPEKAAEKAAKILNLNGTFAEVVSAGKYSGNYRV